MRLPRTIALPFGYRVNVRQVTPTQMFDLNEGGDADGLWDVESRTIYVSKALPIRRRRAVLIHELLHVLADFQHSMLDQGIARN